MLSMSEVLIFLLLGLQFWISAVILLPFALVGRRLLFRLWLFPLRLRLLGSLFLLGLLSCFWLSCCMVRLVVRLFGRRPLFRFLGRAGVWLVFLFLGFLGFLGRGLLRLSWLDRLARDLGLRLLLLRRLFASSWLLNFLFLLLFVYLRFLVWLRPLGLGLRVVALLGGLVLVRELELLLFFQLLALPLSLLPFFLFSLSLSPFLLLLLFLFLLFFPFFLFFLFFCLFFLLFFVWVKWRTKTMLTGLLRVLVVRGRSWSALGDSKRGWRLVVGVFKAPPGCLLVPRGLLARLLFFSLSPHLLHVGILAALALLCNPLTHRLGRRRLRSLLGLFLLALLLFLSVNFSKLLWHLARVLVDLL